MNGKSVWFLAAVISLVLALVSFSQQVPRAVMPSIGDGVMQGLPGGAFGQYQAVRISSEEIVIMETTTGNLFRVKNDEIKPYKDRPQGAPIWPKPRNNGKAT